MVWVGEVESYELFYGSKKEAGLSVGVGGGYFDDLTEWIKFAIVERVCSTSSILFHLTEMVVYLYQKLAQL
jgi:hypothetical protein